MTMKEYYDLYLKKENEENCKICGETCEWDSVTKGYRTYCSTKCMRDDKDYYEKRKIGINLQDKEKAKEKRKITCLEKYGVDHISKSKHITEKVKKTCLEKYGVPYVFNTPEIREKTLTHIRDNKEEVNKKRKKWWEENKKRIPHINKKRNESVKIKYGVNNVSQLDFVQEKVSKTNLESGYWIPNNKKSEWEKYCIIVQEETKKNIPILFSEWDGLCYYFKDKLSKPTEIFEPYSLSIDHKISKKYGFENKISPIIIGSLENLCICSRIINIIKNSLTEQQFLQSERYKKYKEKNVQRNNRR
jgi:hypothetical protein